MQQTQILFPMALMASLTLMVGVILLILRIRAVRLGEVNPRYFLLNRGGRLPDYLARVDQNFSNLFELPVLFYALVLGLFTSDSVTPAQLVLAWAFVLSRVAHTLVHTTANHLRLRALSFTTGGVLLIVSWGLFTWQLVAA